MEVEGNTSDWKAQNTGIRQGCPLSPYLLLIFMTVMFADIKTYMRGNQFKHRIQGTTFDEILFADDTISFSSNTRTINRMLRAIEEIGWKSGMRLNKGKCEMIPFGKTANVVFKKRNT